MPRVAVTMGDPAGVGPEICLRALAAPALRGVAEFTLVGSRAVLERCAAAVGLDLPDVAVADAAPGGLGGALPGVVSAEAGRAAYASVRYACAMGRDRAIEAIVTAPVNKESLRAAGCALIGHTEILADEFGVADPLTMFLTGPLRVFFLTRHLSLRRAIDAITQERVLAMLRLVDREMRALGFLDPHIAVAALNPHASDGGQFGDEEARELAPAVEAAQAEGIRAAGPIPADSVFHQGLEGVWDCVLSLYHDQGHIATKTRDFFGTVTATLGLPVLRTSVDHGTAYDIAWQGTANESSMVRAIQAALDLLAVRDRVRKHAR